MNDRKSTIIFVYPFLGTGGIETLIYKKSKWLISKGYRVLLITSSKGDMLDLVKSIGVDIIFIDEFYFRPYVLTVSEYLNSVNKIIGYIEDIKDILIVECFEPFGTIYGVLLSKILNVKVITGVYHPKAYIEGFEYKGQAFDKVLQLFDKGNSLIFMSEEVLYSHEKFYNMRIENKNVLRIPIEEKEKVSLNKNSEFTVVSIGRLVNFKKYVLGLISDFDKFWNQNKDSKLIIIGDGNEKHNLIKFAKKFKSYKSGRIIFMGKIPYDKLEGYLKKCDMVIGMGSSIIEAASLGIPGIVAPAYTENNLSNGYIFDDVFNVGDEKNSCINTYKYYMDEIYYMSEKEVEEIRNKCRQSILDEYSIEKIMNNWINIVNNSKMIEFDKQIDYFHSGSVVKQVVRYIKKISYLYRRN